MNNNWFTWIFCCLCCIREKYNSAAKSYYKYGKIYSVNSLEQLYK